jgi:hypothetical protein
MTATVREWRFHVAIQTLPVRHSRPDGSRSHAWTTTARNYPILVAGALDRFQVERVIRGSPVRISRHYGVTRYLSVAASIQARIVAAYRLSAVYAIPSPHLRSDHVRQSER